MVKFKWSRSAQKTDLVISKYQREKLGSEIRIKVSGKRFYSSQSVKNVGIKNEMEMQTSSLK